MPERLSAELEAPFEPLSGDDLDRIDATGSCEESEFVDLVQTAQHYRQQAMDLRDALREAAGALEQAGFTFSADKACRALLIDGTGAAE